MEEEVNAVEAARLTGLSDRTIRRKIKAGLLPARAIGPNRYAIKKSDLSILKGHATGQQIDDQVVARLDTIDQRLTNIEHLLTEKQVEKTSTRVQPAHKKQKPTMPEPRRAPLQEGEVYSMNDTASLLEISRPRLHEILVTDTNKETIGLVTNEQNGLQHYARRGKRQHERIRSLTSEQIEAVRAWRQ